MDRAFHATPDIGVLPSHFPIPGMGFLPVNAFVIKAEEPVLVDTGMGLEHEAFMEALESIIDPKDLRWVWITHDDADHTGNIQKVLEAAPNARLAANSLAALRMSTAWPVPMDRVYWLNFGDTIKTGDHELTAVRPPIFDNPTTIGIYDNKSEAFFSADFFGAIIPSPVRDADELTQTDLTQNMINWASADSPWVHMVEPRKFSQALDKVRQMAPKMIFSAHLPPVREKTAQLFDSLETLPASTPFVTPNQTALLQILAQMRGGS
jgi:flavorubredoxin